MKVYEAIAKVSAQMAKDGISKSRENREQHFKFRGIDETLNALAPVLAANGLVILPRMLTRTITERLTQRGNPLFSVVVEAEFDFVAAEDGTMHTVKTFGEAMDTADKATNKAMSIAYKYAAFLAFCIPVEGMGEDADATKHEVAVTKPAPPIGYSEWLDALDKAATHGTEALREVAKQGTAKFASYLKTHDADMLTALTDKAKEAKAASAA